MPIRDVLIFGNNIGQFLKKKAKGTVFKLVTFLKAPISRSRIGLSTDLYIDSKSKINLAKGVIIKGLGHIEVRKAATLRIDSRAVIFRGSEIIVGSDAELVIKENASIGSFSNIRCDGKIVIGKNALIAQFCSFIGGQYEFKKGTDVKIGSQGFNNGEIEIGDDAWIGTHVVILPGVTIGTGAVVGAGSIVTRDVPPYTIVAGNPAKIISKRE